MSDLDDVWNELISTARVEPPFPTLETPFSLSFDEAFSFDSDSLSTVLAAPALLTPENHAQLVTQNPSIITTSTETTSNPIEPTITADVPSAASTLKRKRGRPQIHRRNSNGDIIRDENYVKAKYTKRSDCWKTKSAGTKHVKSKGPKETELRETGLPNDKPQQNKTSRSEKTQLEGIQSKAATNGYEEVTTLAVQLKGTRSKIVPPKTPTISDVLSSWAEHKLGKEKVGAAKPKGFKLGRGRSHATKLAFHDPSAITDSIEVNDRPPKLPTEESEAATSFKPNDWSTASTSEHNSVYGSSSTVHTGVKQKSKQITQPKRYQLRDLPTTEADTTHYPNPYLRKTPPLLRSPAKQHLVSEQVWCQHCQRKGLDPNVRELNRTEEKASFFEVQRKDSPFNPPPPSPYPYSPDVQNGYESGNDTSYHPFGFDKSHTKVGTGLTADGRTTFLFLSPKKVESRPLLRGNFTESFATERQKHPAQGSATQRTGSKGKEPVRREAHRETLYTERESDVQEELDIEYDDATDIESESAPPSHRKWQSSSRWTSKPLLLRDAPYPHHTEQTTWANAVRHAHATGEPWPVSKRSIKLAAEAAANSGTRLLRTLEDFRYRAGSDGFWAVMWSKTEEGRKRTWTTYPRDIREASGLFKQSHHEFVEWFMNKWYPEALEKDAQERVERMQTVAWDKTQNPEIDAEENPIWEGMSGDFEFLCNLE
jgi:hypothetical protein